MTIRDNKVSSLYRELEPAEPPSTLDQTIIAAARREISGNTSNIRRLSRWTLPLSAAAVLVIGVSTLMMIQEREPQTFRPPSDRTTAPYMTSPSSSATDATRSADAVPTPLQSKSQIPTPEHAKQFDERRQEQESIRRKLEDEAYRQIQATEAERRLELAPKRLAEERKLRDETILNKQKKPLNEIGSVNDFAPTPAAESAFGGGISLQAPIPDSKKEDTISGEKSRTTPPATASRPAAEAWLKKIAQLKHDGKTQEAATELIAFKHVYPNFPATQRDELLKQFEHELK